MLLAKCLTNKTNTSLPFVTGFALQDYLIAEVGIKTAYDNNYQHWYIDGSLETDAIFNWNKARILNILKLIEAYQVTPIFHGNYKVPLSSDIKELRQTAIRYTKKEIKLAALLSAPLIIHGGAVVEPRLVSKVKKLALENYRDSVLRIMDYADKLGVEIYLENLSNYKNYRPFHYIFTHDKEFEYILNATNAPFFLDVGHANICEGNPAKIIEKYHMRIVGMSFSNNDGVRDQHLALNKGTVNYHDIITAILNKDWKGFIGFETRGRNPKDSINDLVILYNEVCGKNCFLKQEFIHEVHSYC